MRFLFKSFFYYLIFLLINLFFFIGGRGNIFNVQCVFYRINLRTWLELTSKIAREGGVIQRQDGVWFRE